MDYFLFKIFPFPSSFPDVIFYDFSYRLRLMFHQMSQTIPPLTHAPQGLRDQQGLLAFRYVLPVFMLRIKHSWMSNYETGNFKAYLHTFTHKILKWNHASVSSFFHIEWNVMPQRLFCLETWLILYTVQMAKAVYKNIWQARQKEGPIKKGKILFRCKEHTCCFHIVLKNFYTIFIPEEFQFNALKCHVA